MYYYYFFYKNFDHQLQDICGTGWIKRSMVQYTYWKCKTYVILKLLYGDIPHDLLKFSLLPILPNFLIPFNLLKTSHAFSTLDNSLLLSLAIFYCSQLSTIPFPLLYNTPFVHAIYNIISSFSY